MQSTVAEISSFRFNSLHKYMAPIYAQMNLHAHESKDRKSALFSKLIPQFFRRMREYREITIGRLAELSRLDQAYLEAFESGEKKSSKEIELAYLRACGAEREMDFFFQQAHEFQNPSVKDSKIDVAKAALRQFGVTFPGVDYQHLHSEKGVVLSFRKRGP